MEKRKINRFCEVAALVLALAALLTLIGTGLTERVHLGTWGGKTEAVAFLPISPVQGAALLTVLAAVSAASLQTLAMSAPEKPGVCWAINPRSKS